jgi:hypothetical protein
MLACRSGMTVHGWSLLVLSGHAGVESRAEHFRVVSSLRARGAWIEISKSGRSSPGLVVASRAGRVD